MIRKLLLLALICSLSLITAGQTKTAVTSKQAKFVEEINLSSQDIAVFKEQTQAES